MLGVAGACDDVAAVLAWLARMSDVKTRHQVGPPASNGLKLSAQPFIPQQAQAERPASTLAVTAAPFNFPTPATGNQGNGAPLRPPGPGAERWPSEVDWRGMNRTRLPCDLVNIVCHGDVRMSCRNQARDMHSQVAQ